MLVACPSTAREPGSPAQGAHRAGKLDAFRPTRKIAGSEHGGWRWPNPPRVAPVEQPLPAVAVRETVAA
jgi:hypothetical protein